MHRLLNRQIRKCLGDNPDLTSDVVKLLATINTTYEQHDADRKLLQRSMDLSSDELLEANALLSQEATTQALILNKLKDSIRALRLGDLDEDLSDDDLVTLANVLERNITERKQAEEALQDERAFLDSIVEHIPVMIFVKEAEDLRFVRFNKAGEDLLGYSREDLIGKSDHDFYPEEQANFFVEKDREVLESGTVLEITEEPIHTRNKGTRILRTQKLPIRDENGRTRYLLGISEDITERKQAEEALTKAKEVAETATRTKSAFLANMSHEIRTPMNGVIGMTTLLLDTPLTDEQHEFVETIRASGDALLTVINDILDFSKIESGKLDLEDQPFEISQCVEGALDLVAQRATRKGLELAYLIDESTPLQVVGDVTRVRQILVNLLSNAVRFTEAGEVFVTVQGQVLEQTVDGPRHQLCFSVHDTGIGIPANRIERLFKSFSQVDASTTRKYGGTGLGLAISKRLSEMMGGRIWVESEEGEGSSFHVTITAPAVSGALEGYAEPVQPALANRRVLVVDPHPANQRILRYYLEKWGMDVAVATSGQEALTWIEQGRPFDAALIDLHMPEMDGLLLPQAIRSHRDGATLPLIMLTSLRDSRVKKTLHKLGVAMHLAKPLKPAQLHATLVDLWADKQARPVRNSRNDKIDPAMGQRHPLHILLAEDNVVNQKVALRMLQRLGYRADLASNGLEVLMALERQAYDVVLMDVQMPELGGLEATREIVQRWPASDRPSIIAMTAGAMEADRERCLEAGMDDYISKPVKIDALIQALKGVPPCNRQAAA